MRVPSLPAALACVCLPALACTGSAQGSVGSPSGASTAAAVAPVPAAPRVTPTASSTPVRVGLAVLRERGNPAFLIAGQRMIVRGVVAPYVAGQRVKLSVYRDGRKVAVKVVLKVMVSISICALVKVEVKALTKQKLREAHSNGSMLLMLHWRVHVWRAFYLPIWNVPLLKYYMLTSIGLSYTPLPCQRH